MRLRIIEQLDYGEIARWMGCTRGRARSLVFGGLRRLSHEFDAPSSGETMSDRVSDFEQHNWLRALRSRRTPNRGSPNGLHGSLRMRN